MGQIEVVDDDLAQVLRKKTLTERLAMAFEANRTIRSVLEAAIAEQHPEWSRQQILQAVARRML
ncbi:MAG TPA: hypothetical protein VGG19_13255, partial [Tepidisphaeraceae bacterium]